jgi:hypothetical protein
MNSPGFSPEAAADAVEGGAGMGLFDGDAGLVDAGGSEEVQTTRGGKPISDRPWNEEADGDYEPQEVSDSLIEEDKGEAPKVDDEDGEQEEEAANDGDEPNSENEEGDEGSGSDDLVELTIDGEKRQVPLNELADAYTSKQKGELDFEARVSDLTNQAQNVVSQHIQQVTGVRNQLVQQLQQLQQYQQSNMPSPPDPRLANPNDPNYDPDKYVHQQATYQQAQQQNQAIQQHIAQQQAQMQQEQSATLEAMRTTQRTALQQKWPEWADAGVRQQFLSDVQAEYGFSDEEVASIYDHRFYLLARDAIASRKATKAASKPVKRVTRQPDVKGRPNQAKGNNPKAKSRQDALKRVRRSGRLEDIAASFEDHLPDDIL